MARVAVLGCATGIGAAGARILAARGDRLALGDLNGSALEALAGDLDAEWAVLDASDPEAVRAFVGDAAASLGGLEAAWSNLGVQIAGGRRLRHGPRVRRRRRRAPGCLDG